MSNAFVYRCHQCSSITEPPEPYKLYVSCSCGATTAATAAQVAPENPAAHLTIPGALEWDGDNGTHGADGESRDDGEHSESAAAIATLKSLGYTHNGGTHWKPPVGQKPDFDLIDSLRAQLASTEQSRRSFFDLSKDLEKRLAERDALLREASAWIKQNSFGGSDAVDLWERLDAIAGPEKCERCGDWGHIETEDSAHDCPECGPSVIERAVEAGVMNAPKPYAAMSEAEADEFLSSFGGGSGNKAKRRIAAIEAAKAESFPCWSCRKPVTMEERAAADGDCPHCAAELDLEDWPIAKGAGGCAYEAGDWQCREGGYLWYAGDGEGYDPEDNSYICPCCRTADYLEAAKDDAESCSRYSNNGASGTGLDIWTNSERTAMEANRSEAIKALAALGPVAALDDDETVICNAQQVAP